MPVTHGVAGSSPVQTAKKPNAKRWAFCIQVRSKTGFSVANECKKHPHRRCRASLLGHPIGSAKARQRRRQSRFLSLCAAEMHEKERTAVQGFFAGPPHWVSQGVAAPQAIPFLDLQRRSFRKRWLHCRASLLDHPCWVRQGTVVPKAIPFLVLVCS